MKSKLFRRVADHAWLLGACRDWETLRAMKSRPPRGAPPPSLRFRRLEPAVLYRPGSTDVQVAWEIFRQRQYACALPWRFDTIVDCGASVGMFAAFALRERGEPFSRYVAVEADPEAFRMLERQIDSLGLRATSRTIEAAAWSVDGEVRFDDSGPSWAHRVSSEGRRRVRAMRLESILDEASLDQCDLLKLDIEGGEREVLPSIRDWGPRVRAVVAELHDGLDYRWFARVTSDAGFRPYPPGALFRDHPGAIRNDVVPDRMPRRIERARRPAAKGSPSTR
jgi:FkbM family methyltransferase